MQRTENVQEISCQQVLLEESSVYSAQWMLVPTTLAQGMTPPLLLQRYLAHIRKSTFSLINPTATADGLDFRVGPSGITVLSFNPPQESTDGHTVTLSIRGGKLVQPDQCHRGQLHFVVKPEGETVKLMLELTDYCPLLLGSLRPSPLHRGLYRLTQALIHRKVTISFLARVYEELTGGARCVRVVRVKPDRGREI